MPLIQDLNVSWKLSLSVGSVLLLMLVVNAASFRTAAIEADAQRAVDESVRVQRLADDALTGLTDMETGYRGYLLTGRQEFLEPYTTGQAAYRTSLTEVEQSASRSDQLDRWRVIATLADSWQQTITEPGIEVRRGAPEGAPAPDLLATLDMVRSKQQFDAMRAVFAAANQAEGDQLTAVRVSATVANVWLVRTLIIGTLVALTLGGAVAVVLSRDLTSAIGQLAEVSGRIADGDLSRRITLARNDEVGRAGRAFNQMAAHLQATIQHLKASREDLVRQQREVEQRRQAFAQSEKLRALGQMATGIAHDLNQTLMLVASYSDLARQAANESPPNLTELEAFLTTTAQAALDGGETVKRLLLFTRAAPANDAQIVDLTAIVREAAQLTAPRWRDAAQADGRPISLVVETEGRPTIRGSASQLREVMTNLIFNAVDALPTGGTIRLRVAAENAHGVIEVVDSGVGMSAETQERVFEPFFTTKGEAGSGLGLSMVFGMVEQHGGHIGVRSVPGNGTTFRLTFPLVSESTTPALAAVGSLVADRPPPRPLRILVVDDEPMMTRVVIRMLKPSGHVVSAAASGEEALERLSEQAFDVVVSDLGMGAGINGWELAAGVRRGWPHVRFLLATGWGAAIDPSEARARGVDAVLAKPYRLADLSQLLAATDKAA